MQVMLSQEGRESLIEKLTAEELVLQHRTLVAMGLELRRCGLIAGYRQVAADLGR